MEKHSHERKKKCVHWKCLHQSAMYQIGIRYTQVCTWAKKSIHLELISVFSAWGDWEYYYSSLDRMQVHRKVTPQHFIRLPWKLAGSYLYPWVERGTVKLKCFGQEHNTLIWTGLKPSLCLVTESSVPAITPIHLPLFLRMKWLTSIVVS